MATTPNGNDNWNRPNYNDNIFKNQDTPRLREAQRELDKLDVKLPDDHVDWVDLYSRARWDRLLGLLIVLVLLLILIIAACSSCGKKKDKPTGGKAQETTEFQAVQPTTEAPVDYSKAVFLSPSTQYDNLYACDNTTTEGASMIAVATLTKQYLEADGYTVFMCGEDDSVKEKVEQGNTLGCGAYVAIHSNSGGESGNGVGTECYYNTNIDGSFQLSECVYNKVAALTPTEDRGNKDQTQRELYELLNSQYACCYLEVEFHDLAEQSQWILNNQPQIARAIADGIEEYLTTKQNAGYSTVNGTDPAATEAGAVQ